MSDAQDQQAREGQAPEAGEGTTRCERCGRLRPASWQCGCGGHGGGPVVPEGWDPELTRTSRPRLPLTRR